MGGHGSMTGTCAAQEQLLLSAKWRMKQAAPERPSQTRAALSLSVSVSVCLSRATLELASSAFSNSFFCSGLNEVFVLSFKCGVF